MKYRKKIPEKADSWMLGMLYIVDLRLVVRGTREVIKHRILMVGCEAADIERKLRWVFTQDKYLEISITHCAKVKEKIHVLSTTIMQEQAIPDAIIERPERSQEVFNSPQAAPIVSAEPAYDPRCYAVGIATTVRAADTDHALRKVGNALLKRAHGRSAAQASLSEDSTVTVEEIAFSDGFAKARDVSTESNKASFVRG